jgi:hypothetical protein
VGWFLGRPLCLAALIVAASCVDLTPPSNVQVLPGDGGGMSDAGDGPRTDAGPATDGARPEAPADAGQRDAADGPPPVDAPGGEAGGDSGDELLGNGRPCMHGGQCDSNLCVDGVCCASACAGACVSCRVAGQEGSCVPVPAGEDLREQCAQMPATTCQQDGSCDGAGACRRYRAGAECAPASCSASTEQAASTCDGAGTCRPGSSRSCAPQVCAMGSCGTVCASDAQCLTGFFCETSACRPKRGQGAACTAGSQCATGHCADGLCCDSACTQGCHSCSLVSSPGVCAPAPAGTDPRNECAATDASTCGTTGQCNGQGACQLHVAGTACGAAASCAADVETSARTCNGLGVCLAATTRACAPYVCSGAACATSCSTGAQCQGGNVCSNNACVPSVPVDAGGGAGALLLDDFSDASQTRNTLGGAVTWDNATVALVGGEQRWVWNGNGVFNDFIETFRNDWCEYNASGYTRLRFRMRASTAGRAVKVYFGTGSGSCSIATQNVPGTVTLTTTMASYELSITPFNRARAITVEFAPQTNDGTEYFVDDIALAP